MSAACEPATNATYLRAGLGEAEFAVPSAMLIKILSDSIAIAVPDAPEGVCGIVYDDEEVLTIRSLCSERRNPTELIILCGDETARFAYGADRVEDVGELTEEELAESDRADDFGILLLGKGGCRA